MLSGGEAGVRSSEEPTMLRPRPTWGGANVRRSPQRSSAVLPSVREGPQRSVRPKDELPGAASADEEVVGAHGRCSCASVAIAAATAQAS
jgi:hypothetical protein